MNKPERATHATLQRRVGLPWDAAGLRLERSHTGQGRPYDVLRCDRTGRRTVRVR